MTTSSSSNLSAADMLAIQNLYARYNQSSDAGDAEGYAGCFTPDGVLDGTARRAGRVVLSEYKRAEKATRANLYRQHWTGSLSLIVEPDGTVTGRCYFMAYNGAPGELPRMTHCGSYLDTIVRLDGEWLFALRKLHMNGKAES